MELAPETTITILQAEAAYQSLREQLAKAKEARELALYVGWCEVKDPKAVASSLPRSITAGTVKAAVIRHAPPSDYELLALFEVE